MGCDGLGDAIGCGGTTGGGPRRRRDGEVGSGATMHGGNFTTEQKLATKARVSIYALLECYTRRWRA